MTLSPRGEAAIRSSSAYTKALIHLPATTINLATAENQLTLPQVTALLNKIPPIPPSELTYTSVHGSPETLQAISTFLSRHLQTHVPKHVITITSGVSASLDALAHALADESDAAITSSPCYRGLNFLLSGRAGVRLLYANTDDVFPPRLTIDQLQRAWEHAGPEQSRIKFLLLVNPDNPTGIVHPPELVIQLVEWAREHGLHVVIDECYALSAHNDRFSSALSYIEPRDDVHIVWGVSKDFALPGIRIGAIITYNEQLQRALHTNLAYFSTSSRLAQYAVRSILPELDEVILQNRQQLRETYIFCKNRLEVLGVQIADAEAGFFVWAWFRRWVQDHAAEERLWNRFCGNGVLVLPGKEAYAETPGCFRICFAGVEREILDDGLNRIEEVLRQFEREDGGG